MSDKTKQFTVKELAKHLGVEYIDASGFLKVLTHCSDLVPTKKPKAPGERGKSSFLFDLPSVIEIELWQEKPEQTEQTENKESSEVAELHNSPINGEAPVESITVVS